ncbi:CHAT domain-containing protein [Actinoplanes sp. NPDC049596]|uniref:CHAT domain-containing protein n=1 Tax=Actinoplanes sp. NPDC049596 TaxID=3154625 RepID=UPI003432B110
MTNHASLPDDPGPLGSAGGPGTLGAPVTDHGDLGDQCLDRYEADPDLAHLDRALAHYEAAIAAGGDGLAWWLHAIAMIHRERADRTGDPAAWTDAITAGRLAADALIPGELRDEELGDLAHAHHARLTTILLANHRPAPSDVPAPPGPAVASAPPGPAIPSAPPGSAARPAPPDSAEALARAVAAEIALIAAEVTTGSPEARLAYGMTLGRIATLTDDPADLEAAVAVLGPAVEAADPDGPFHAQACADLCFLHLFGPQPDPDRAIEAGRRGGEDGDPVVRHALACAYQERWDTRADESDLDRAIDHWRAALADVPEPGGMADCGRLLGERAERQSSTGDATEAVTWLERAAAEGEPCWWALGLAYRLRAGLADDPADLHRAAECLDRGIADPPWPEWLLYAHRERLDLTQALVLAEETSHTTTSAQYASTMLDHIAAARAVFDSGLGDHDERAALAAVMAADVGYGWQEYPELSDPAWMLEMVAFARTRTDKPPEWDRRLDSVEALARYLDRALSGGGDPGNGLQQLLAPLRDGEDDPEVRRTIEGLTPIFLAAKAIHGGDRRLLATAIDQMRASGDPEDELMADGFALIDRARQGDAGAHGDLRAMLERLRDLPASYALRASLTPMLSLIESIMSGADGVYRPVDRAPIPPGDVTAAGAALIALPAVCGSAVVRHDVVTMREAADRVGELLDVLPPGHAFRLMALGLGCQVGIGLLRDEPRDQPTAERVIGWATEGLGIAEGPRAPLWSQFALVRAEALRHRDGADPAESRRWGLVGLHGFGWQVLLQAGTDEAVLAAADAGEAARRVAGWCRADGAYDDLVAAVDAGRGLMLQAATNSRTIADRLVLAGRPDLADRWRTSAGYGGDMVTGGALRGMPGARVFEVPDDLRSEVLHALQLGTPEFGSTHDIRVALAATETDALVYLLPTAGDQPGCAVIVPVRGDTRVLILPGLRTNRGSAFAQHTTALHGPTRDTAPTPDGALTPHGVPPHGGAWPIAPAPGGGRDAGEVSGAPETASAGPDELCRWAWSAAMSAVLRHVRGWELGRPARLVLVPTGPLAAVPWHAAYRNDGERRRYAIEQAVISYAVSGRAFAQSARETAREVKSVLVVGDPTGDLPAAGAEARAIGDVFYPDGTFLGRADGSPRQVLAWVAAAAPGPSLLHLACHGQADPEHPGDTGLRLAGGRLTARQLLEASRTAELEIEQVFLAACTTGVVGARHDEAFSLATAFLSAGARTVFGSLWRVPDEETSLLMFLVHHHLNTGRCSPADALRQAQLWMLDPDRAVPPTMPAELARHGTSPRLADPLCWAGFTHQGV